jgi:hypothetical protein
MNLLFLSPAFPPTAPSLCTALAAEGVTVLGVGDEPLGHDRQLADTLRDYVHEPRMGDYEALRQTVQSLIEQYGPLDRVDSNGEHWLTAEARLRDDFGIPGLSSARLARQRSKLEMAEIFEEAGLRYPATVSAANGSRVRELAREHGYPLVFKPQSGSGAADTFRVLHEAELSLVLERHLDHHVVQPFISDPIVTFDGLTDGDGRIVFSTSHAYDTGIMQVRQGALDGFYYSQRVLPPALEQFGARAVAAFDIRERFFHLECFEHADGSYTALEMNLRPPGGFTTDMMNIACDIDIYRLWAQVMVGRDLTGFRYQRRYHTAHAGRRADRHYRYSAEELRTKLGDTLWSERAVPPAFAVTMGDVAYLLRHAELDSLRRAIDWVQAN